MAVNGTHLIDLQSTLTSCEELNLFGVPPTQVAINSSFWQSTQPKNNLDSRGPWVFETNTGPYYGDFNKNYLYMKIKLVREDGKVIDMSTTDKVGVINMIGSTLFKTIKVSVQGKLISDSKEMYGYRVLLETELNHDIGLKEYGHLKGALYSQDRPPSKTNTVDNIGWKERRAWFDKGNSVEIMAPLRCDLFNCEKFIPTHTNVSVEIIKQDDSFILLDYGTVATKYTIMVDEMRWLVHMVDVNKTAHMAIETSLQKTPAKYPIRRVEMTRINVSQGATRTPNHTLFQGQIPRRIIFGCVRRDAFNGSVKQNPFRFENFGIKEVTVTAGNITYNRDPLRTDFEKNIYLRAYLQLLETVGKGAPSIENIGISP